jgi:hypothetical protein
VQGQRQEDELNKQANRADEKVSWKDKCADRYDKHPSRRLAGGAGQGREEQTGTARWENDQTTAATVGGKLAWDRMATDTI